MVPNLAANCGMTAQGFIDPKVIDANLPDFWSGAQFIVSSPALNGIVSARTQQQERQSTMVMAPACPWKHFAFLFASLTSVVAEECSILTFLPFTAK